LKGSLDSLKVRLRSLSRIVMVVFIKDEVKKQEYKR
jgi:hypothetical protein